MQKLLLFLWLSTPLFAYQKGDVLDERVIKKMGIEEDKIYIIDFFASWCNSCKKEIPLISNANEKINKTKIEIIGVDVDKDSKKAKAFQATLLAEKSLNFRVIDDVDNAIVKIFNPKAMPAIFYIKDRKVLKVLYGAVDKIDKIILEDVKMLGL